MTLVSVLGKHIQTTTKERKTPSFQQIKIREKKSPIKNCFIACPLGNRKISEETFISVEREWKCRREREVRVITFSIDIDFRFFGVEYKKKDHLFINGIPRSIFLISVFEH